MARLSQLRIAASMLRDGHTAAQAAEAVNASTRTVERWKEQGLLDDVDLAPASGEDVLREIVFHPATSTRDRQAAAANLARIEREREKEGRDDEGQSGAGITNISFEALNCPNCTCPRCRSIHGDPKPPLVPPDCPRPPAHGAVSSYPDGERRACGCPV